QSKRVCFRSENRDAKTALRPHRPWLCAVESFKTLYIGHLEAVTRVIARRDARVRSQQHGCAVCGQRPVGEKESFFGDFLPISKKLPAGRRTAEAFDLRGRQQDRSTTLTPSPLPPAGEGEDHKLDSSLTSSAVIELLAGMTSESKSDERSSAARKKSAR